jgi:hypothetical protein
MYYKNEINFKFFEKRFKNNIKNIPLYIDYHIYLYGIHIFIYGITKSIYFKFSDNFINNKDNIQVIKKEINSFNNLISIYLPKFNYYTDKFINYSIENIIKEVFILKKIIIEKNLLFIDNNNKIGIYTSNSY